MILALKISVIVMLGILFVLVGVLISAALWVRVQAERLFIEVLTRLPARIMETTKREGEQGVVHGMGGKLGL